MFELISKGNFNLYSNKNVKNEMCPIAKNLYQLTSVRLMQAAVSSWWTWLGIKKKMYINWTCCQFELIITKYLIPLALTMFILTMFIQSSSGQFPLQIKTTKNYIKL